MSFLESPNLNGFIELTCEVLLGGSCWDAAVLRIQ